MSGLFKLTYGTLSVTLSPLASTSPRRGIEHKLIQNIMLSGKLRAHTNYIKLRHELEVNNVNFSNASLINSWKENAYTLVYQADTTVNTTVSAMIVNDDKPLNWMEKTNPDSKFRGLIMLREV